MKRFMDLQRARSIRQRKRFDRNETDEKRTEFTQRKKENKSRDRKTKKPEVKRRTYRNIRGKKFGFKREKKQFESKPQEKNVFSGKKMKNYYSGGSEKFYSTIKEKLFKILGGKKCASCGFRDDRALGFTNVHDYESFDLVKRSGFVASWGKYISEPEIAKKEIRILCLNCNAIREPIQKSLAGEKPKKSKFFPRKENIRINSEN